jgi:hypothetical protein
MFGVSQLREEDLLYSTVVTLKFETSYLQFLTILYHLADRDFNLGNRVVTYTLGIGELESGELSDMMVRAFSEMPENIRDEFFEDYRRATSGESNEEFLRLITVEMQVEYLTLSPGTFQESYMRETRTPMEEE